ncbi:diaminopimelate epimerase [Fulvivirga lutea]|uniref:Diaminopimelate epimerase n=1 Tax=Fulvivirga lutea TaxID=2810512 RepID=A0A975A2J8_9BACT|nr:diaminopimelate epimerase [Fulvivirga lutea]QSE98622.1 diaminopimelate epimerase [Fulvivirga lutea]
MTQLPFFKYQATGNDFILLDNTSNDINHSVDLAKKLCDRKFGIGSDGLIVIQNHPDYDFEMVFYNPDGSQSLCGNGSRCAVNFAKKLGLISSSTTFLAHDGPHEASILEDGIVKLKMSDVHSVREMDDGIFIDTGSPHLVDFVFNHKTINVFKEGKSIRNNNTFKEKGVNVNFVEVEGNTIHVRTYERGVEDETLSCGTGVTAAALASSGKGLKSPIAIKTKGGELEVAFQKVSETEFKNIYLIGPALEVFTGVIELN